MAKPRHTLRERNRRLEAWKQRTEHARLERDQVVPIWLGMLRFFRSNPPTNWPQDSFQMQINYVFAWFETMWPTFAFHDPVFMAEPLSKNTESSRQTNESALNAELRSARFGKQYKKALFDFFIAGIGILQSGYYSGGMMPRSEAPGKPEGDAVDSAEEPDENKNGQGSKKKSTKESSDLAYGFRANRLYVKRHAPEDFLMDPQANDLDEALWCGIEFVRPLELVKNDSQYQHTDTLHADEYEIPPSMTYQDYRKKFNRDPDLNMVRLIQIWDIRDRQIRTFNMNHGHFLQEIKWNLPTVRFPFYPMRATEDNYRFWNQSLPTAWIALVEEFNHTISNRLDHLSRNKPKMAYNKDAMDEPSIESFLKARNMTVIGISGLGADGDVKRAIAPIQMANMPADHWGHLADMNSRFTEISGQSEFDRGGTRPGERPATEINRISAGSDLRRFGVGLRIQEPLSELAQDVHRIMRKYYTEEQIVQITNEHGSVEWVNFSGETLRGEYLFRFNIEDLAPTTKREREQRAGTMLQLLTPYTQVGSKIPRIDIDPILRHFGRELQMTPYLKFFPMVGPPMDPGQEFFLIVEQGMDLQANPTDNDDWHVFTHLKQLERPEMLNDPSARVRLENHMESHDNQKLAKQEALEAQQKVQSQSAAAGGTPGPDAGGPSNNQTGGAGVFSGDAAGGAGGEQAVAGGAGIENLASLLRSD